MADPIRDAATLILARPTRSGSYEVLLTKRPDSMRFMGGTYVFPGGALDPEDCDPQVQPLSALAPAQARSRIGEDIAPERALGLYWCGVRELFEEVGILLARHGDRPVDPATVAQRYAPEREAYAHRSAEFAAFLRRESLVLATDTLVWHGRLITPESSPIRFDARFFVAPMPEKQEVLIDPREVTEAVWMTPIDAISAAEAERMPIPLPTMSILQGLSEVPGYQQLLRGARVTREVKKAPLSPLVFHVLAPNPGLATGPGTNTYIVGRDEVVVIDPAVPDPAYIDEVAAEVKRRGRASVILLTHMHPDHVGGAAILAERLQCPVAAWHRAAEATEYVTRGLNDGDVISAGGATLRALHTPGHASHHLCYLLDQERSLFAGDVVAGLGTVVISPPDGNMADYMATLDKLLSIGVGRIFPGHGPVVEDGPAKLTEYLTHRRDREHQVVEALQAGASRIPDMVKRIYDDISPALHAMAELSVLAHLQMLESQGKVRRSGDEWIPTG